MPAAVGQQLSTIQAQPPQQQNTTQVIAAAASEEFAAACQYTEQKRAAGLPVQLTASTEQHVETAQQLGPDQQVVPAAVSKQLQLQEDNKYLDSKKATQSGYTARSRWCGPDSIDKKLVLAAPMDRLPALSLRKLLDLMDPSQPADARAAAARELAPRLPKHTIGCLKRTEALRAFPQGVCTLAQLLTYPGVDSSGDTQLAGLEVITAVWAVGSPELSEEIAGQPGVMDCLAQLLREGGAVKQAAVVGGILEVTRDRGFCPPSWYPPKSDPANWPILFGLVGVLQPPAASAEGKANAAAAIECLRAHECAASPGTAHLPYLTINQLSDHMAPSQPAAAKAAAARELARRLREFDPKPTKRELAAFQALPQGMSRLVQLIGADSKDCDTQLAALEVITSVWAVGSPQSCEEIAGQPGVVETLGQLLQGGSTAIQATAVGGILALIRDGGSCPSKFYPSQSDPNSWPIASGLVAVLQSSAASVECKGSAAAAIECLLRIHKRKKRPGCAQLHPDIQAAIGPLVGLLQQEDCRAQMHAAQAIGALARGRKHNKDLIGGRPWAISRLWQLTTDTSSWIGMPQVLISVFAGHSANESLLVQQSGFMEDLLGLLGSRMLWRFTGLQLQELQQHVTEVHTQLSASQQEQQLLQGQLARLGDDNTSSQTELAGTQKKATNLMIQATSKGQEAKVLCKKLATVHASITSLRAELAQAQQEVVQLRQQVQLLESVSIKSPAAVTTAESKGTAHCGDGSRSETEIGNITSSKSNSNAANDNELQSEAYAAAWRALLPSLTIAQLSDQMAPSQPVAVKAAVVTELGRRLMELRRTQNESWLLSRPFPRGCPGWFSC